MVGREHRDNNPRCSRVELFDREQRFVNHCNAAYGPVCDARIFPFAKFAPKDNWRPHINLGVPVTSKSLYRPYFGVSEPIGGLLTLISSSKQSSSKKQIGFPLGINFFVGMTWMKTHFVTDDPNTTAELTADLHFKHVWKPVYGIEVPISSIASKIKGAAGKNSNGNGKTASSGSGGS